MAVLTPNASKQYVLILAVFQLALIALLVCSNTSFSKYDNQSDAENYRKTKQLEVRAALDEYTIFSYLGDLNGLKILDFACGEGYYSRKFIEKGAASVTGVDISQAMIELARQQTDFDGRIQYVHASAAEYTDKSVDYDLVTGIFLLHYAQSIKELESMFQSAYDVLKPGGVFLALNQNPALVDGGKTAPAKDYYHPYGFEIIFSTPIGEGSIINVNLFNKDGTVVSLKVYNYSLGTYKKAAEKAGFTSFEVLPMLISPEALEEKGQGFWQRIINKSSGVMFRAVKSM